jgi:hypothetical protein
MVILLSPPVLCNRFTLLHRMEQLPVQNLIPKHAVVVRRVAALQLPAHLLHRRAFAQLSLGFLQ